MIYAVIDTNVLVSALFAERKDVFSPPREIVRRVVAGNIIPIIHKAILQEYNDVLYRDKFHFDRDKATTVIDYFTINGIRRRECKTNIPLLDEKDRIFLEVALAARKKYGDAYLVTGNKRHFPDEPFILSPAELLSVVSTAR